MKSRSTIVSILCRTSRVSPGVSVWSFGMTSLFLAPPLPPGPLGRLATISLFTGLRLPLFLLSPGLHLSPIPTPSVFLHISSFRPSPPDLPPLHLPDSVLVPRFRGVTGPTPSHPVLQQTAQRQRHKQAYTAETLQAVHEAYAKDYELFSQYWDENN